MGSVLDNTECPNCKQEAISDFYYKSGEQYITCSHCGYYYAQTYRRDGTGRFITVDGTDDYNIDNLYLDVDELKEPYGAYKLKYLDAKATQVGSLANESDYGELRQHITGNMNVDFCTVSRFIDGKFKKEVLIEPIQEV